MQTLVFGLMQSRDGHKFENWSIIGTSCQYLAAYATLRWLVAHACGACPLGALHCLHRVFSGVLHFGTAMRRWVTHLPRDLRPRHFLFAPRLQTVHPEVEVKQESFREPFCYVLVFVHWLLCAWSVSGRIISLCACLIRVSIISQLQCLFLKHLHIDVGNYGQVRPRTPLLVHPAVGRIHCKR